MELNRQLTSSIKSILLTITAVLISLLLFMSCDDSSVAQHEVTLNFVLGDKDGFGIGLLENEPWSPGPGGTTLPLIFREPNDPHFTDIYPADLSDQNQGNSSQHWVTYTQRFNLQGREIISVKLIYNTLGIQDGDSQVTDSDTEIKLFIDEIEIKNAFDDVDQFDYIDGGWKGWAEIIEIEIPAELNAVFNDGIVNFRWEIHQLGTIQSRDAFAIDYSEIEIKANEELTL